MRTYALPVFLEKGISDFLKTHDLSIGDSRELARCALKLSEHYISNPEAVTPWKETWAQIGYITYFLPLNYLRARHVFMEAQRFNYFADLKQLTDYGSGPGTVSLVAREFGFSEILNQDHSTSAQGLHKSFFSAPQDKFVLADSRDTSTPLGVFSYSLTEARLKKFQEHQALIIIEPSTREDGRPLLELRQELLAGGYFAWAPCTHQLSCPLLENSKKDWCHDRIFFSAPGWFLEMEKHLPMKNQNLTLSYLVLKKTPPPDQTGLVRVVGDRLDEKGKVRQMVCGGENRQFLSWLKREGEPPELRRGDLLNLPSLKHNPSQEIRAPQDLQVLSIDTTHDL